MQMSSSVAASRYRRSRYCAWGLSTRIKMLGNRPFSVPFAPLNGYLTGVKLRDDPPTGPLSVLHGRALPVSRHSGSETTNSHCGRFEATGLLAVAVRATGFVPSPMTDAGYGGNQSPIDSLLPKLADQARGCAMFVRFALVSLPRFPHWSSSWDMHGPFPPHRRTPERIRPRRAHRR